MSQVYSVHAIMSKCDMDFAGIPGEDVGGPINYRLGHSSPEDHLCIALQQHVGTGRSSFRLVR